MTFVVAGIGYTGGRVLSRLPPAESFGISRTPGSAGKLSVFAVDLDKAPLQLPELADRYTLLYTVAPRSDKRGDPRLAALLDALKPAPLRIVYLSTSGVYGDCGGALVNESRPTSPATERAQRRLAAESLLQDWSDRHAVELLILRVAAIYGPGRLGMDGIRRGKAIIAPAEANPGNRIHVEDLADCCAAAMQGVLAPGIYNVCDGDHRSPSWFATTVARLAGLDPPPQLAAAAAERTFSATRMSFLSESRRLDNTKLLQALGHALRYADAEDGIRASLDAEREARL